jgi:translation elongation factor EF-4
MDLQDTPQPEIVIDHQEVETMIIAHLPITEEVTYEISSSEEMQIQIETPCSSPAKIEQVKETLISAKILAQAEDLRKLMLLQDTIKRFSKKK